MILSLGCGLHRLKKPDLSAPRQKSGWLVCIKLRFLENGVSPTACLPNDILP